MRDFLLNSLKISSVIRGYSIPIITRLWYFQGGGGYVSSCYLYLFILYSYLLYSTHKTIKRIESGQQSSLYLDFVATSLSVMVANKTFISFDKRRPGQPPCVSCCTHLLGLFEPPILQAITNKTVSKLSLQFYTNPGFTLIGTFYFLKIPTSYYTTISNFLYTIFKPEIFINRAPYLCVYYGALLYALSLLYKAQCLRSLKLSKRIFPYFIATTYKYFGYVIFLPFHTYPSVVSAYPQEIAG